MTQLDLNKLFPEDVLIAYANELLSISGSDFVTVYGAVYPRENHVTLQAQDENRKNVRMIAPVCEFAPGIIAFRSLLLTKDTFGSWLSNGQASVGCKELAFFGENGPKLVASRQGLSDYFLSGSAEEFQNAAGYREYMESTLSMQLEKGFYTDTFDVLEGPDRRSLVASATPNFLI